MKRLSKRQRLLAGAFLLAAGIAAIDRVAGRGSPVPATAGQTAPAAAPAAPAGWKEVDALVLQLTRVEYSSVADDLASLDRDVFVPTMAASTFLAATAEPVPADEPAEPPAAEPQVSFVDQHRLSGVILGDAPLAVIDEQLMSVGAELDGFTLVQIERDYVLFAQSETETRIVLELAQRPKNP